MSIGRPWKLLLTGIHVMYVGLPDSSCVERSPAICNHFFFCTEGWLLRTGFTVAPHSIFCHHKALFQSAPSIRFKHRQNGSTSNIGIFTVSSSPTCSKFAVFLWPRGSSAEIIPCRCSCLCRPLWNAWAGAAALTPGTAWLASSCE